MKLFAPSYYQRFACIASACRHSCCIGWEIDVDEDTLEKYERLPAAQRDALLASIDRTEEGACFRLGEGERCPHLDGQGLCRIISTLGEGYLCDICREHPRFYHDTPYGREVGLGMACEEAARIILSAEDYATFLEVGTEEGEAEPFDFDPIPSRERIYGILAEDGLSLAKRMEAIEAAYGVSVREHSNDAWRTLLADLEYLNEAHRTLFACYTNDAPVREENEPLLARALAYFVFRHVSDAKDGEEARGAIGFALFATRLLAAIAGEKTEEGDVIEAARIISEELEYSEENTEEIKWIFLEKR